MGAKIAGGNTGDAVDESNYVTHTLKEKMTAREGLSLDTGLGGFASAWPPGCAANVVAVVGYTSAAVGQVPG